MRDFIMAIENEFHYASGKFPKFCSAHEGYAVILEELDELWDAIKENAGVERIEEEATQVGAMALRFLYDICANEPKQKGEIKMRYLLKIEPAIKPEERHKIEDVLEAIGYCVHGGGTYTDASSCGITFSKPNLPNEEK